MAVKTSPAQRKTLGRVMHEYAHGELKSGRSDKGGKVKSRRQAVAIALKEAGASKYESRSENKRNLARSKRKEAAGRTYRSAKARAMLAHDAGGARLRRNDSALKALLTSG